MKQGRTLQELAIELDRQQNAKKDYRVETPALSMAASNESIFMNLDMGTGGDGLNNILSMDMNDVAHRQIGTHLGIPGKYYDKMRTEYPELLTANVNGWFNREPSTRMLRTLDGRVRAFLSDRYRRIDNFEIASTVLPIIMGMDGAKVESCELTDQKMYIKVINPRITAEVRKGDVVQAGILISNSEVGLGSVTVMPLIYRLVCLNGMIAQDSGQRKYHVGRGNESGDGYEIFRDETIQADDRAFLMKIEDTVRLAVDQSKFDNLVTRMREATEAKMEPQAVAQVVELASKNYGLTQYEGKGVLAQLIQDGDLSLFGLANAVTRHSQDIESYDRATALEAVGWDMLNMSRRQWLDINAA